MSVINPVKLSGISELDSAVAQPVDERTVQTVRQQYQASHQEEFLRLRLQAEALLMELKLLAVNLPDDSKLAL